MVSSYTSVDEPVRLASALSDLLCAAHSTRRPRQAGLMAFAGWSARWWNARTFSYLSRSEILINVGSGGYPLLSRKALGVESEIGPHEPGREGRRDHHVTASRFKKNKNEKFSSFFRR